METTSGMSFGVQDIRLYTSLGDWRRTIERVLELEVECFGVSALLDLV